MILNRLLSIDQARAVETNQTLGSIGGTEANIETVMNFIVRIIDIALNLAVVVGVIMILYSAFLYVSSFGEESKAETAKKTLLWSVIGTVVVFLARTLVNAVNSYLS